MLRRFCTLDLSKHQTAIQSDWDSCQTSAMPMFTRPLFPQKQIPSQMYFWMVWKERAQALVKTIRWAFWHLFIFLLLLFAPQARDCSVLCDRCAWWGRDEVRPKVKCIQPKLIIVCRRLRAVKNRERQLVAYACRVCCGARTVKIFFLAWLWYHLKKASQLDNFR